MTQHNVESRLIKTIVEYAGLAPEKVIPQAELEHDLGLDSLDRIELMMCAEDEFSIDIPDEDIKTVHTVADAVALVERKIG